jgi:hypothetical protein
MVVIVEAVVSVGRSGRSPELSKPLWETPQGFSKRLWAGWGQLVCPRPVHICVRGGTVHSLAARPT